MTLATDHDAWCRAESLTVRVASHRLLTDAADYRRGAVAETVSAFGGSTSPGSRQWSAAPSPTISLAQVFGGCAVNCAAFVGTAPDPAMLASGGGAIVNMSSTAGQQGVGGLATYVSTKHGLEGLTKVAALDYAAAGVRVNAIAPGPILTDNLVRAGAEGQRMAAMAMPMQRIGTPDEVAAATVWLCSDHAAFITGTTLVVDGGKLAGVPPFMVKGRTN